MIPPIIWAVVFSGARKPDAHFVTRLLHKDFAHVFLIREAEQGAVVIDPLKWGIATVYEPHDFNDVVEHYAADASAILLVLSDYNGKNKPVWRGFYNCVTIVKAMLALKAGLVFTPRQLYNTLRKRGDVKIIRAYDGGTP